MAHFSAVAVTDRTLRPCDGVVNTNIRRDKLILLTIFGVLALNACTRIGPQNSSSTAVQAAGESWSPVCHGNCPDTSNSVGSAQAQRQEESGQAEWNVQSQLDEWLEGVFVLTGLIMAM